MCIQHVCIDYLHKEKNANMLINKWQKRSTKIGKELKELSQYQKINDRTNIIRCNARNTRDDILRNFELWVEVQAGMILEIPTTVEELIFAFLGAKCEGKIRKNWNHIIVGAFYEKQYEEEYEICRRNELETYNGVGIKIKKMVLFNEKIQIDQTIQMLQDKIQQSQENFVMVT